MGKSYLLKWME